MVLYVHTEQVIGDSVFIDEFLKGLPSLFLILGLFFPGKHPGGRKQVEDTYNKSHQTYRKEGEEAERLESC